MVKVLVIGSNSFSGASFVADALRQGFEVIGTSRSAEPENCFLPYKWDRSARGFQFYQFDLNRDLDAIMAIVLKEKPPYVVNFAAQSMVAESWQNPLHWFQTNVMATVALHERLRHCDFLDRYVHVTTPEVYGSTGGFISENAPFNPSTPYAVSRAASDMSLRTFFAAYGLPVVFTRAANVYGPGQQLYRIIPRSILFMRTGRKLQLHGGGHSRRSFIYADDVAEATRRIMLEGRNGETYHISTNEIVSIRELVERIAQKLGVIFSEHVEIIGERLGKDAAYMLDSGKLRQQLGWTDRVSLDSEIDNCIGWVNRHLDELRAQPVDYVHKP